ncbi:hypothetical protein MNBD_BACTEROID05-756 [hydrothermal vent metagenome]|uniref:FMN-binding domain-containing protein n=1 Tax=hydrothermal vent metagenome TaxID=652676 RepID=A0A3B0T642_9ZZZZ
MVKKVFGKKILSCRRKPVSIFIVFLIVLFCSAKFVDARYLISADKALKKIFKEADSFDLKEIILSEDQIVDIEQKARVIFKDTHLKNIHFYIAKSSGQNIGLVFEDTVMGKWGPIHYLVGVNLRGSVVQIIILDYDEIRGKPIAKRRFLKQYKNKSSQDPVKLRQDIDGVSGATISSRSLTNGIRKLLFVFAEIDLL